MNAISTVIRAAVHTFLRDSQDEQEAVFIIGNEMYCETTSIFQRMTHKNIRVISVDVSRSANVERLFQEHASKIKLFFWETCTNPSGHMLDLRIIKNLRQLSPLCWFVADNTWLTSEILNPFEFGIDVCVLSLTKYYSGGRCISGAVIARLEKLDKISDIAIEDGIHVSPDYCKKILRGISEMKIKVMTFSNKTLALARWLESNINVNRVLYPLLPSHPSFEINKIFLQNRGPGVVLFHMSIDYASFKKWVNNDVEKFKHFVLETSFGDETAKIDTWPEPGACDMYDASHSEQKIERSTSENSTWIRIAMGSDTNIVEFLEELDTTIQMWTRRFPV